MAMANDQITVHVHVAVDIDGTPITEVIEAPARLEQLDQSSGLHIHLSLDGRKLAKALMPHITSVIRLETDGKRQF